MESKEKILLTKESYQELKTELELLINTKRPEIIKQIQEAREQGDLSENADYDAAKERQTELEKRVQEIQAIIDNCVIDQGFDKKGEVSIYNYVEYLDLSDNQTYKLRIVGPIESDPDNNMISSESPLAKAILSRKVNETIEVKGIDNHYQVTIKKISTNANF